MQITIDTNNLSQLDIDMLAFLAGQEPAQDTPEPEAEKPAPKKAPAKKAAPAKKPVEVKDPEPEADDEPEADGDAPTMSDAVAAATQLVSSGKSAKVKAALESVGAKRVSEMDESDVPAFLAALED